MSQEASSSQAYTHREAKKALIPLLFVFVLSILCLQSFNLVFPQVGKSVNAGELAPLITAVPGIVLGIVSFVYGSLGDFVSLKKMSMVGLTLTILGSVLGFFVHFNAITVILARAIQTGGAQFSGSVFLVVAARWLRSSEKVIYFGIFTAAYQLATALGVVLGGWILSIDWTWLFLIPALSVFCIPSLMKNLPDIQAAKVKIDVPGFLIFGLGVFGLTLFFSLNQFIYLAAAIVLFVLFGFYINKAENPFITPAFFKNTRWLKAMLLVFLFYFANYAIAPLYNSIITHVYSLPVSYVSSVLLPSYIVALILGTNSGLIIGLIGRKATYAAAAACMFLGLFGVAFFLNSGLLALTISACFIFAGFGLIYSPQVDTVLSTVQPKEVGRSLGIDDLFINVSASIGVALAGSGMGNMALGAFSVFSKQGVSAVYSNIFLGLSVFPLVGLVLYLFFKTLHKNPENSAA